MTASGEAAPTRRYYGWRARHPASAEDSLEAFQAGYRVGGGDALRASSELAELVPRLRELIWWIEAEDRGYEWGRSNAMAEEQAIRADGDEQEALPF